MILIKVEREKYDEIESNLKKDTLCNTSLGLANMHFCMLLVLRWLARVRQLGWEIRRMVEEENRG